MNFEELVRFKSNNGLRERIKKVASLYIATEDPASFMDGVRFAMGRNPSAPGTPRDLYIEVNRGIFVFSTADKSESEWHRTIESLEKKQVATPPKTLVKMAFSRLSRLMRRVRGQDNSGWCCMMCQRYIWNRDNQIQPCGVCSGKRGEWEEGFTQTIQQATDTNQILQYTMKRSPRSPHAQNIQELSEVWLFLERPDVTLQTTREAYDLLATQDVMED